MKEIAIIGAGGFGREVKMLIDQINRKEIKYDIIGFYDDDNTLPEVINGVPFLGSIENLSKLDKNVSIALGIGEPKIKKQIIKLLERYDFEFPSLIHPSVHTQNDNISIGKGCIICANTIITCDINIGEFVTLNLSCTVGHDTKIESFSSFMPSVNISGEVIVNEGVYVGTGAKIINQLQIGKHSIIGAGAVVSKSIEQNSLAVGVPAKIIKKL